MTLPFDIPEKNQRKYQCFVCGVMFTDFVEYKEHIVENHEEGREYVLCPLERCGTPVRDLKLHYKVKHPSEKLPKKGMMRAIIWKDFSPRRMKGKTKKPQFREGHYESTKMGRSFHYRSGYECRVYECLDSLIEVEAFAPEPFKIGYTHQGEKHEYIPDLLVSFMDGHKELWEVKPASQTTLPKNKSKWKAAEHACELRGWKFVVVTEQVIQQLINKVRIQNENLKM